MTAHVPRPAPGPPHRRTRRLLAAVAALLLGATAGACGIPADDDPRAISPDNVPPEAEAETQPEEGATVVPAAIWFTRSDGTRSLLARTQQQVAATGSAPSAATVLDALFEGPPNDDVGTSIPAPTAVGPRGAELVRGLLTVDLNDGINDVRGDGAALSYGQMVCTVDELPGVEGVLFTFEGESRPSPRGDGVATDTPLTCEDYDNLRG
jgi:spore germination protein GerM